MKYFIIAIAGLLNAVALWAQEEPSCPKSANAGSSGPKSAQEDAAQNRVQIILVDPYAPQAEVVQAVLSALKKAGVSPTLVTRSEPRTRLHVELKLLASENYDNVVKLTDGLGKLDVPKLQISFSASETGKNLAVISAGSEVEPNVVEKLKKFLDEQSDVPLNTTVRKATSKVAGVSEPMPQVAIEPENPPTALDVPAGGAKGPEANPKPPFSATMLIVEADWTKSATGKVIEQELQHLLKDVAVPDDLRQNVLANGPQILFAPRNIAQYTPQHCAELLAWLDKHKLLKLRMEFSDRLEIRHTESPFGGGDALPNGTPPGRVQAYSELNLNNTLLPLPIGTLAADQPFVKTRAEWIWSVRGGFNVIAVRRMLVKQRQFQGQTEFTQDGNPLSDQTHQFALPLGSVAIVHAFAGADGSSQRQTIAALNKLGFAPLLLIQGAKVTMPEKSEPVVRVPDVVQPVTESSNIGGYFPESGSGRNGRRTTQPPNAAVPAPASGAPAAPPVESIELKIFSLLHADAAALKSTVEALFPEITITVDARTNSLLARGPKDRLMEVEAVLMRLDQEETKPAQTKQSPQPPGSSPPSASPQGMMPGGGRAVTTNAIKQQYEAYELQAIIIVRQIRELQPNSKSYQNVSEDLKAQLRQIVGRSFALRQQLQRAEIEEFQQRIQQIQQTLAARDRIQDAIIDRRVSDLLNPDARWELKDGPAAAPHDPSGTSKELSTSDPFGVREPAPVKAGMMGPAPKHPSPAAKGSGAPSPMGMSPPGGGSSGMGPAPRRAILGAAPAGFSRRGVVWIEIVATDPSAKAAAKLSATYLNGTAVSPDGLIAVTLTPGTTEQQLRDSIRQMTVFVMDQNEAMDVNVGQARLAAVDAEHGLALLKLDTDLWQQSDLAYLTPQDRLVAAGARVSIYYRTRGLSGVGSLSDLAVAESPRTLATKGEFFTLSGSVGDDTNGAAVVDLGGQLVGILGGRAASAADAGPSKPGESRAEDSEPRPDRSIRTLAIPASAVVQLIKKYRSAKPEAGGTDAGGSKKPDLSAVDPKLEGIWKAEYTQAGAAAVPEKDRLWIVYSGNLHAVWMGQKLHRLGKFRTEKRPDGDWVEIDSAEGTESVRGWYEISGDGLRLNLSSDAAGPAKKEFGTAGPEFKHSEKTVPVELAKGLQKAYEARVAGRETPGGRQPVDKTAPPVAIPEVRE